MNANLGSVSHGTARKEDLIPDFCWELNKLDNGSQIVASINAKLNTDDADAVDAYFSSEESDNDLELLFNALNDYAPPYSYFGAHPGDGSDYGFWVCFNLDEFDGMLVSDTSEVPEDYEGEVLHVNDHGNMTLYFSINGVLNEVWSIV